MKNAWHGRGAGAVRFWTAFLLPGLLGRADEVKVRLTEGQAREVVTATVHSRYPEPCYSTYRNDRLERLVVSFRGTWHVDENPDAPVYFYRVASDNCNYDALENGKPVRLTLVTMDCCEYGIVAVDRSSAKSYWFKPKDGAEVFAELARDEQMRADLQTAASFLAFYRELVWGDPLEHEITSLEQLRTAVQRNFESAYSPYEKDDVGKRKFEKWWRRFLSRNSQLTLVTTYEQTGSSTRVHGYSFKGFALKVPRSDEPPKGKPTLFQWTLLFKPDGTVERLPSQVVYSNQ